MLFAATKIPINISMTQIAVTISNSIQQYGNTLAHTTHLSVLFDAANEH
jgi:hypothetical protein